MKFPRKSPHHFVFGHSLAALVLLTGTANVYAGTEIIPHALVRYEHDSNLLMVPNDDNTKWKKDASGQPRLEDTFQDYSGGVDLNYKWRDNRYYITTNYQRFVYQKFSQLDHNGFAGTTGIDWVATRQVKGNVGYIYDRHQLSFIDVIVDPTVLNPNFIETTQQANASANYDMNSHWRGEFSTSYSTAKLPDAGTQSYDITQTQALIGAKYIGAANLITGVSIDRRKGHYRDTPDNPNKPQSDFTQTVYQYSIDYKIGTRTSVSGTIGYSTRAQDNNSTNDNSATVGSFSFNQQITAKTSYFLQFKRTLDTYNTLQGSQLSTSGIAGINYQATPKISLSANYERTKATVSGVNATGGGGTQATSRNDEIKAANASLKYSALRWLTVSPYYRYQRRDSGISDFSFRANTYGVDFEARFNP